MSIAVRQLTPLLIVPSVEDGLAFWRDRLGFVLGPTVPGPDGALGFAILEKDGQEVMLQTVASPTADMPADVTFSGHSTALFLTVENLDVVERALEGVPVVKPRHQTFYGSTEIYVREPGGCIVGFAQMG